jgi:hypothetical protein
MILIVWIRKLLIAAIRGISFTSALPPVINSD